MASRGERGRARRRSAERGAGGRAIRVRSLLLGAILAAAVGFGAGWLARLWSDRSPEERAREAVGELRERAHELTR